jgi:hypothetical protein
MAHQTGALNVVGRRGQDRAVWFVDRPLFPPYILA